LASAKKEGRKEIMSEGIRSKAGAGATQVIIRQQEVNTTTTLLAEEEETVTDLPCVKCQLRLLHSFTQPSGTCSTPNDIIYIPATRSSEHRFVYLFWSWSKEGKTEGNGKKNIFCSPRI
jgi:hypothetical protein